VKCDNKSRNGIGYLLLRPLDIRRRGGENRVMKFSLFILPCYRPELAPSLGEFYEELAETVRYADGAGWDRVWLSEHHFHYYGGACPNPALLLTAWARETKRIRLAAGVSLLPLNDPVRVAEDYAMLDRLSGGRLDFGIGRGYLPHEFRGRNVAPADATGRFQEAFEVVTRAWQGERFSYAGTALGRLPCSRRRRNRRRRSGSPARARATASNGPAATVSA
jgi:alkanesulfonate monooxygenase SsuD/methylene tetrahydromethanopterin reductase-like flavin-dependent oxidoreductase (luciferase family)